MRISRVVISAALGLGLFSAFGSLTAQTPAEVRSAFKNLHSDHIKHNCGHAMAFRASRGIERSDAAGIVCDRRARTYPYPQKSGTGAEENPSVRGKGSAENLVPLVDCLAYRLPGKR